MTTAARFSRIAWFCALLSAASAATAQQHHDDGPFRVHYNAFTTDTLTEQVAKNYGIVRSRNRALLNVSVQRRESAQQVRAVTARVSATAINLNGQLRRLEMRELVQGDAIYYIAEMPVTDQETYNYNLSILPDGAGKPIDFRFSRQFFVR